MYKLHSLFTVLALAFSVLFVACDSDDDDMGPGDQETITTVRVNIGDLSGTSATFTWTDPEGDGSPIIDPIELSTGTAYTISVEFFDDSAGSFVDITEEVAEESLEHLVCFAASGGLSVPVAQDADANGDPLGLEAAWVTGNTPRSGNLTIRLKHEPNKGASDPCATGETDVEVSFPVQVI